MYKSCKNEHDLTRQGKSIKKLQTYKLLTKMGGVEVIKSYKQTYARNVAQCTFCDYVMRL